MDTRRGFLLGLASLLFLATSSAHAIPIELTFQGTLTSANEVFGPLGVGEGTSIKGTLLYESETPADAVFSDGTRYEGPFLDAWVRIGDDAYTLTRFPSCCDSIFVAPDFLSFDLGVIDSPDLIQGGSLNVRIAPYGIDSPIFSGELPTEFSSKRLQPTSIVRNRILGLATERDASVSSRLRLTFDLERVDIRPFEGDLGKIRDPGSPGGKGTPPVPEPSTALLLGLGLASLAGMRRPKTA